MGVTTYLTTDLAAIPLFWVIPLVIYLLSFILAFARSGAPVVRVDEQAASVCHRSARAGHERRVCTRRVDSASSCGLFRGLRGLPWCAGAGTASGGTGQHVLRDDRRRGPAGWRLHGTRGPARLHRVVEYPLAIILACLVAPGFEVRVQWATLREWLGDLLVPGIVFLLTAILVTNQVGLADSLLGVLGVMIASGLGLLACVTARRRPMRFALTVAAVLAASSLSSGVSGRLIHVERSFFGVVRVTHDPELNVHRLFHGTTLHGQQSLDPALAQRAVDLLHPFRADRPGFRVARAAAGSARVAGRDPRPGGGHAGELRSAWPELDVLRNRSGRRADRRRSAVLHLLAGLPRGIDRCRFWAMPGFGCARRRDRAFALIVLDAFSSDSLPVHLLSREAIRLYRSKLAPGGVLAFNLSNRYLDLDPVLGRQAADAGLACRIGYDIAVSAEEKRAGKQPSIWAVMAESEGDLVELASDPRWRAPKREPGGRLDGRLFRSFELYSLAAVAGSAEDR